MQTLPTYSTVLLAIDGSKESLAATAHATSLAKALGAKLLAVYVVDTHTTQSLGVHYAEGVKEFRDEGTKIVEDAREVAKAAGVQAEVHLIDGNPGRAIVQTAEEQGADLIVMGATGKSGLREMLLGSVSSYVADNAKCPVMVVRA